MSLEAQIETLRTELSAAIAGADNEAALDAVRVAALGKKGSVSALLATLGSMAPEDRKSAGPAIFATIAALVLLGGFLFATQASIKKGIIAGICTVAGLGLVSTGAVMAIGGEREIEAHPTISADPSVCSNPGETEIDEHSSQSLAAKSNVAATIFYDDGRLYAQTIGIAGEQSTITLQRGAHNFVVFRNLSSEPVRLTAHLGEYETDVNGTTVVVSAFALYCPSSRSRTNFGTSRIGLAPPA